MVLRLGLAALAAALVMGCQGTPAELQWTKKDTTLEDVKRDLYWCTTITRERPRVLGTPADPDRLVSRKVDDQCMEKRGYTKVAPKG